LVLADFLAFSAGFSSALAICAAKSLARKIRFNLASSSRCS
jgi:hypothetical protein